MATKMKRMLSLILCTVCLVSTLAAGICLEAAAKTKEINGHALIAENDRLALYLQEENLSIIVEDKATGSYMESAVSYDDGKNNAAWLGAMKSPVVLTLIKGSVDNIQADMINDEVTKEVKHTANGFEARLYWTKYKIGMKLEVSLTEDGIVVRVPDESIVEEGKDTYIGSLSLYPYLGSSYLDDKEGYMLIPDGNGALIYLEDKEGRYNSGYVASIYGTDAGFTESSVTTLWWDKYEIINSANNVLAPVYGLAHTEDGIAYLAVIEKGQERARIEAIPNGANINYNRIYASFIERKYYTQPVSNNSTNGSFKMVETDRSHSDLQIHYIFLSGDEANYSGMANAYRSYLLENGEIVQKDDSYRTRVDFLGTDRETWVVGTSAVVMTTAEDIKEIYADLKEEGVTELFSVYKGWQKGGIYNLPITKFKADSKIGGNSGLLSLMEEAEAAEIPFYLYNDALRINPEEKNATFNTVKQVNKRKLTEETYKDVYEQFMYLTPARSQTLLSRFAANAAKKGINNLAVAGISNTLFSYSYSGAAYSRFQSGETYAKLLSDLDESTNLVLEQPFAYLWKYTDSILDMPLYTSSYVYEDESVPFLSMVLKGVLPVYSEYVNFEANKQEFFLKMVETGTFPSFYITKESSANLIYTNSSDIYSSEYGVYKDTILSYTKELKEVNAKVEGAFIIGHEIRENGITVVSYDNGVKIYVNYGEKEATADGHEIPGMSYKVVE